MIGLAHVLVVAAALFAAGALAAVYRRDQVALLTGIPLMAGGAGLAAIGASRLAASVNDPIAGQEFAVVIAAAALATVFAAIGLIAREASR